MEKMNKKVWSELFEEAGMTEASMRKWHEAFERRLPGEHQRFLAWLGIPADEIDAIRRKSQA